MNAAECNKNVSSYRAWLRKGVSVTELDGGSRVMDAPFPNRHNDTLQVVAEKRGSQICLHDNGETLEELAGHIDPSLIAFSSHPA